MRKSTILFIILVIHQTITINAQTAETDSLAKEIRSYVARNFSKSRTFNLYWEVNPSHDYKLKQNGQEIESGKIRNANTVKFATTVPLLLSKNFSLYANGQANFYTFDAIDDETKELSSIFSKNNDDKDNGHNYYKGALSGTYRTKAFGKPLILNANISGDGWGESFEKIEGTFSAIMVLKNTPTTTLSVGMYGMTRYNEIPAIPIITYWHQFNPNLSIDITLPSRTYLRYQISDNHRFSLGALMESEQFYMKPNIAGLPETCLFSSSNIKPELVYEFIVNKHFYFIARGGGSAIIQSGLFKTNRKGVNGDPLVEFDRSITPFFNLGFSYNIFK